AGAFDGVFLSGIIAGLVGWGLTLVDGRVDAEPGGRPCMILRQSPERLTAPAATTSKEANWRVYDERRRVQGKNSPVRSACRRHAADGMRDDPQFGSALHRAAAGGGRIRDAASGHSRTAAAPRCAATLPARESPRT